MRRFYKIILIVLGVIGTASVCDADIIHFQNGNKLEGIIVSEDDKSVILQTSIGTFTFGRSDIKEVEKADEQKHEQLKEGWEEAKKKQTYQQKSQQKTTTEETKKPTKKAPLSPEEKKDRAYLRKVWRARRYPASGPIKEGKYSTPEKTLTAYMKANKKNDGYALMDTFTEDSKELLRQLGELHGGGPPKAFSFIFGNPKDYEIEEYNKAAIVFFEGKVKDTTAMLLVKEKGQWKVDYRAWQQTFYKDDKKGHHEFTTDKIVFPEQYREIERLIWPGGR